MNWLFESALSRDRKVGLVKRSPHTRKETNDPFMSPYLEAAAFRLSLLNILVQSVSLRSF